LRVASRGGVEEVDGFVAGFQGGGDFAGGLEGRVRLELGADEGLEAIFVWSREVESRAVSEERFVEA
jgi:hypothetical protein